MNDLVISDVRPWGGAVADLVIREGRIAEVLEHGVRRPDGVDLLQGD